MSPLPASPENPPDLLSWLRGEAPLLFLEVGRDDTIIDANAFTKRLVGSELVDQDFRRVIVDFSGTLDPRRQAREDDPSRSLSVSTAAGSPQDFLCSFITRSPDATYIVGAPDAEEIARMDRHMLDLNRDLGEMTRELQKANAELDRLNRLKNQFLGMATHDLRKPLSLIVGFAELLEEEGEDRLSPQGQEYIEKILSWADRMKRLVEDFLDVSVIEAGRLRLELAPVEPGAAMADVREAATPKAEKRGIEVRIMETAVLPTLRGDPEKLHQALLNLVFNAIEFSQDDTAVEMTAEQEGDEVSFRVRDRGVGMDQEDLDRLFVPFGTTKARRAGGSRGTGLGLIIAREIAEAHGGRIEVESRPGEGSTFTVVLPVGGPAAADAVD